MVYDVPERIGIWDQWNVVFQDNKSVILVEKDKKVFCTGNYRYINVRYFFVKTGYIKVKQV